ncbi:MAG: cysteine desulfurase [Candidatus Abyssobacteria bacterium SURF_17]|uniref:cysteine desulfurase n=1 Tax=Candidatus Abyssobacteria bacterium SURF_17 TaxID=2093361 RepID=A0A419F7G8_9BACT|nr:MAG: cysteine desulfurase [Candidatus Abyssubacteria bacterium SURF_17]
MGIINLDHISGNPLLPEVQAAMIEAVRTNYGNPSSPHHLGDQAAEALEQARQSVARLINSASPKEIVFTSGGTESINHAIKGVAAAKREQGRHIIASNIEHNSVLKTLRRLMGFGYTVTSVPVDGDGRVNPDDIAKAITDKTILISIMHSNNEIGTIQPIEEIARIAREKKVIFHTDAVTSIGVVPIDVRKLGVDLLSFAANQFHGPAGVGGLYIRKGTSIWPLLDGGAQENNRRAGTENLISIIGMGVAAQLAAKEMGARLNHVKKLRDRLLKGLNEKIDDIYINGHPEHCLPNIVSVSISYIEGESIVLMLEEEGIAVSTRSACASGSLRASHVLSSIGRDWASAQGTLVISFGKDNTEGEIDRFLDVLVTVVQTLRNMSPLYVRAKG